MLKPGAAEIGSSRVIPALEEFTRGWGSKRNEQSHSKKRLTKIWAQGEAPGSPGMEVTDRPPGKDRLSARQPLVLLCDSVVRKPEKAEGTP